MILATGQGTDLACLEGSGVENMRGFIVADTKTKMTAVPGVFAGGDGQHGPRTAVEAIRLGQDCRGLHRCMAAQDDDGRRHREYRCAGPMWKPLAVLAEDRTHLRRSLMPERTELKKRSGRATTSRSKRD